MSPTHPPRQSLLAALSCLPLRVVLGIYRIIACLVPILPRLPRALDADGADDPSHLAPLPMTSKALFESHVARYERLYGVSHPEFYPDSYSALVRDTKNTLQYGLVYLHCEDNDNTYDFCHNTLSDPDVRKFLSANNVKVYLGPTYDPEACCVCNILGATGYPFLALLAPCEFGGTVRPVLAYINDEPIDAKTLLADLELAVKKIDHHLASLRGLRSEHEATRALLADQDNAYQRSLLADQDRENKAAEKAAAEKNVETKTTELKATFLAMFKHREERRTISKAEFDASMSNKKTNQPGEMALKLRLPNGEAKTLWIRRTDTVESLYKLVDIFDPAKEGTADIEALAAYLIATRTAPPSPSCDQVVSAKRNAVEAEWGFLILVPHLGCHLLDLEKTLEESQVILCMVQVELIM